MNGSRRTVIALILTIVSGGASDALAENTRPPVAKTCGGSTMVLRCGGGGSDCTRNELVLRSGTSSPVVVPTPQGLEKYDPIGLSCTHAANTKPFFVVEYGDLSHTCASCEWHHVYAPDGQRLTESDPAFVSDPSLPGAQSLHPNTADFMRVSKNLGLSKAAADYGH
ncbi:hypothetical protein P3W24_01725 [Luteibacter sp. PPL201]|jgi:hypothetical protein|uniref:Secreted protein n=1 Tax=Luteibacter sahnii TaxID=3021977 RepID=A0ABT6B6L7_9GAMM